MLKKQCNADNEAETAESCASRRQDGDTQEQYNADNVTEADVVPNPMVMTSNNNKNQSFHADPLINDCLEFLSEQIREDAAKANVKQTKKKNNNNNDIESFLSDKYKMLT